MSMGMKATATDPVPKPMFTIGQRVIFAGQRGIVRYVGNVQFAAGEWVGIQLDKPAGKNDGSVQGVRYFDCGPKAGIFAMPTAVMLEPAAEGDRFYPPPVI